MQRQLALKVLIVFVIGLLVLLPISMVKYKVYERQGYLEQAKSAVAESWTGQQLLTTPVVIIPYQISETPSNSDGSRVLLDKYAVVLPERIDSKVEVDNKSVYKGIYEVPVYSSDIELSGQFSSAAIQQQTAKIKSLSRLEDLGTPFIFVHITDMRGIDKTPSLTINQSARALNPGSQITALVGGLHAELSDLPVAAKALDFTLQLSLRGMGNLSFASLANGSDTVMRSNWPHPEFMGASLPVEREISDSGFSARWTSTRYSSNSENLFKQCINQYSCHELRSSASGVEFIEPVDIYLQSERSVKYAMLFIGLSFITFFIFEHMRQIRIHPIQYAFVGLAISVFYLLLISLAEHIAFHWAYSIGVTCCSALLLFYVRYMLRSFFSAALFSLMIIILYGILYVIVQAEDFALLMGSTLVFLVLAVLMFVTRKIDWYSLTATQEQASVASN